MRTVTLAYNHGDKLIRTISTLSDANLAKVENLIDELDGIQLDQQET